MEHLAYSHLYLVSETPRLTKSINKPQLDTQINSEKNSYMRLHAISVETSQDLLPSRSITFNKCYKSLLSLLPILIAISALANAHPLLATLSLGSSGPRVVELQNRLKDLGYFPKNVKTTGYFGKITQQAAMEFQQQKKIPADGMIGSQTLVALGMSETKNSLVNFEPMRLGSSGDRVKIVQMQLAALDYYKGKIDGNFNAKTQKAVLNFQQDSALESDGVVGMNTIKTLDRRVEGI